MSLRMFSQRFRNIGISSPGMFSATGTRGSLTMPHSMASMREKSLMVHVEGVIVGNDDLRVVDVFEHVARHQFAVLIVAVRVIRLEHAESVFDGQTGGNDEEATGEILAAGTADGVDCLPGDKHGHDGGFACAGGQLQ